MANFQAASAAERDTPADSQQEQEEKATFQRSETAEVRNCPATATLGNVSIVSQTLPDFLQASPFSASHSPYKGSNTELAQPVCVWQGGFAYLKATTAIHSLNRTKPPRGPTYTELREREMPPKTSFYLR